MLIMMLEPEKPNGFPTGWQWAVVICEGEEKMHVLGDFYNRENRYWVFTVSLTLCSVIVHILSNPHNSPER